MRLLLKLIYKKRLEITSQVIDDFHDSAALPIRSKAETYKTISETNDFEGGFCALSPNRVITVLVVHSSLLVAA